jgi:hypothetical protein
MCLNNKNKNTFTRDGKEREDADKILYLGSTVTKEGVSVEDVRNKISEANGAFNQLQKVWKSSDVLLRTILRICKSMSS